ncbi:hypothetical protein MY04_2779 [Flammeovirga sp. MY04]|uniref:hypothetical protein n=1 Tax=Flammeovirga sp. MY04 TaxID=1191459 RepID=UPI0013052A71|nr:hypothetical protein [Flammeovirga sp. MY04]ANQ50147.2 hypothetical protein MY04_2779 [Flammeovirga sp. MY04]
MRLLFFYISLILFVTSCTSNKKIKPRVRITQEVRANLNDEIFGQFLEKPSWGGEKGPEAALKQGTHQLQDGVFELMEDMHIPLLRFPGGTDVDFSEWTSMIDLPNRKERPLVIGNQGDTVSTYFGYDEAGKLSEKLNSEFMLVINFGDGYFKKKPLKEAVMHEMGLIAYMSSNIENDLPKSLKKWPELRKKNGHELPYKIKYVQVANEPWVMDKKNISLSDTLTQETLDHYFTCLDAYVEAINTYFPELEIIIDANCLSISPLLKERYGNRVDYVALHQYLPWGVNPFQKGDQFITRDSLTEKEVWNAWIAVPEIDEQGNSVFKDNLQVKNAYGAGYPVAMTEWNWNGWWNIKSKYEKDNTGSVVAKGFGAAGFLHAIMRDTHKIKLGIQSLLVGNSWGITGIRVSENEEFAPYPLPTGQVTGLYAQHHGDRMIEVITENIPKYQQPYKVNAIAPADSVAVLDIVSSADEKYVYVHIINRAFDDNVEITVDLSNWNLKKSTADLFSLTGNYSNSIPCDSKNNHYLCSNKQSLKIENNELNLSLIKRSINIIKVPIN